MHCTELEVTENVIVSPASESSKTASQHPHSPLMAMLWQSGNELNSWIATSAYILPTSQDAFHTRFQ